MKCITELKDWDFKIPELGFEKRVTLPYTWNVENERPVQLYRGPEEYKQKLSCMKRPGTGQCCILAVYFIRPGYL